MQSVPTRERPVHTHPTICNRNAVRTVDKHRHHRHHKTTITLAHHCNRIHLHRMLHTVRAYRRYLNPLNWISQSMHQPKCQPKPQRPRPPNKQMNYRDAMNVAQLLCKQKQIAETNCIRNSFFHSLPPHIEASKLFVVDVVAVIQEQLCDDCIPSFPILMSL